MALLDPTAYARLFNDPRVLRSESPPNTYPLDEDTVDEVALRAPRERGVPQPQLSPSSLASELNFDLNELTDQVIDVLEVIAFGCPPSPPHVFRRLQELHYTFGDGQRYRTKRAAMAACLADVRAAQAVHAKLRASTDAQSELSIVGVRLHEMSGVVSDRIANMPVMFDAEALAKLVTEFRQLQRDICALNGRPLDSKLTIAAEGTVNHQHSGNLTVSGAYSSWDGGTRDLGVVVVDGEVVNEDMSDGVTNVTTNGVVTNGVANGLATVDISQARRVVVVNDDDEES